MITPRMAELLVACLKDFGYPDVTPEDVRGELAKDPAERSIIGMFASEMLRDHGIGDDGGLLTRVSDERMDE